MIAGSVIVEPGDFCCVPVSGQGGTLIRVGEWLNGDAFTQYQHAEVYVGETHNVLPLMVRGSSVAINTMTTSAPFGWTLGAYPGGARLTPLPCLPEELPGALWSSGAFDLSNSQRQEIISHALSCQGVPYSWLDYDALALHHLGVCAVWLEKYISSTGHLICSQLVDKVYNDAGVHLFDDGRWPGYVTPADLAALIATRSEGGVPHGTRA